ncbi:hypothetical protein CONCODRAFT_108459, partial [Conidiobolus coronatus NRRL 28638]
KSPIKFKFYKDKSKLEASEGGWTNTFCKVINIKTEEIGVSKINRKLDEIESALNSLNNLNAKNTSEKSNNQKNQQLILLKSKNLLAVDYHNSKILNNSDYPRQMMGFYFTMQTYCAYPPVLDLAEFYQVYQVNGTVPDYLLSAIISNACLNTPDPQFKQLNWIYTDYYYNLSLSQFNQYKGEPNIYMIQTLLILSLIDDYLSKPLRKANRVTTAVKLALILEMDKVEEFNEITKPSHFKDVPYDTIRKLYHFIRYWDEQTSKLLSTPTMIKTKFADLEEYYYHPKPLTELPLIKSSKLKLPSDYISMLDIYFTFGNLVIKENEILDFELRNASNPIKFLKCIEQLTKIENLINLEISPEFNYSPNCLLEEELQNYPLTRIKLYFYQKVLDIGLQTAQLCLSLNVTDFQLIMELVDKFRILSKRLVTLIEDQILVLVKHASDDEGEIVAIQSS